MSVDLLNKNRAQGRSPADSLPIRLAVVDYERTRALIDGTVKPADISLKAEVVWVENFCKEPVYQVYDIAEMSFSWYVAARCRGESVVALPIFPLRMAVLAYVFVRDDSPWQRPKDLIGKRIGVPAYRLTINLWLRGFFQDFYDLRPDQVSWISSENEGAGFVPPPGIQLTMDATASPEQRLFSGDVDAIIVPEVPMALREGRPGFRRLFPDAQQEMHALVERAGIYPITHVVVMNEDLYRREPWVARNMAQAFVDAQKACESRYWELDVRLPYPDAVFFVEQQRAAYGPNPYEQGLTPANRRVAEAFVRYAHAQGYIDRQPSLDELFVEAGV